MSVLTPTIPERKTFLRECRLSVKAQTYRRVEHLIRVDEEREGCSKTINQLAEGASGEWLFVLADDDLLLPGCLQAHLDASANADVVYAPPLVWGEDATQFCKTPPGIPAVALIRTELWRTLEGYREDLDHCEDRDFFDRALCRHARFVRVDEHPTWIYRLGHGGNKSRT